MIKVYLKLLRTSLPITESKFRAVMHLHTYHNERTQLRFWANITGIPASQFRKTYVKPNTGKQQRAGYPGCIHVKYHDVTLARKVAATARATMKKVIEMELKGP